MAQRDVPVHVANEYCRPDRSFDPCPAFDEQTLPRVLDVVSMSPNRRAWFPSPAAGGLGVDFAYCRSGRWRRWGGRRCSPVIG